MTGLVEQYLAQELERIANSSEEKHHGDVKLATAKGRFVRIHRAVLCAVSPMIRNLLGEVNPCQCKEVQITLPDIGYADLVNLVRFIYIGEIRLSPRQSGILQKWLKALHIQLALHQSPVLDDDSIEQKDQIKNSPAGQVNWLGPGDDDVGVAMNRHSKEDFQHTCQLCKKHFKSSGYLKTHLLTHTGDKPYACHTCGQTYRYKDTLLSHQREHSGQRLKCPVCDKEFKYPRDLRDHQNVHSGLKEFPCDQCPLTWKTRKQLLNHKETHRLPSDPCSVCGKRLKNRATFRAHMRMHRDDATALPSLGRGLNRQCQTCGKSFKRSYDLKVHTRIHTGDKPYSCEICHKAFTLSSSLAKHKRNHHQA